MDREPSPDDFVSVAEIEVTSALPSHSGFALGGRGSDGAEYRLQMHLDMPVDQRTKSVLGELLAQSEWRVWRRMPAPLRGRAARRVRGERSPQAD